MGLSNVASGGIILAVFVIVLMAMPELLGSSISLQDASSAISKVEESITRTEISVNTIIAPTANLDEVTFSIDNTGEEKLWNFEKFNVIITYDPATGRTTENLSYAGECGTGQPSQGTWCNDGITTDILDPAILNAGESMDIRATVTENISTGSVIIIVSTDSGILGTASKVVP